MGAQKRAGADTSDQAPARRTAARPAYSHRWPARTASPLASGVLSNARPTSRPGSAGRGEAPTNPFERAVANLILGSEHFVRDIAARLVNEPDVGDQPARAELRRLVKFSPEEVEAAVRSAFAGARPARKRRVLLYAQRIHSRLRPSEVARRYGRRPSAVTMACQAIPEAATKDADLASRLAHVEELLRARGPKREK